MANPICPKCAYPLKKVGWRCDGRRDYRCSRCQAEKRRFRLENPNCALCEKLLDLLAFKWDGNQKYFCRSCWIPDGEPEKVRKVRSVSPCPKCDRPMKKSGVKNGQQNFYCKSCRKSSPSGQERRGRPRILPDRILTREEIKTRHKKKKALAALREKFREGE